MPSDLCSVLPGCKPILAATEALIKTRTIVNEEQKDLRYAIAVRINSRWVCRTLTASTAAAAATVRRPARTSLNTSIRFRSRSLIDIQPILRTRQF